MIQGSPSHSQIKSTISLHHISSSLTSWLGLGMAYCSAPCPLCIYYGSIEPTVCPSFYPLPTACSFIPCKEVQYIYSSNCFRKDTVLQAIKALLEYSLLPVHKKFLHTFVTIVKIFLGSRNTWAQYVCISNSTLLMSCTLPLYDRNLVVQHWILAIIDAALNPQVPAWLPPKIRGGYRSRFSCR